MKRIVVLTAYNVERTLVRTLEELPQDCWDELLLVDDGSQDGTRRIAESLHVPCVSHPKNLGYGAAQKTGFRLALERGADVVILLHADHQYDARCIPGMLNLLSQGHADAVFGSRRLGGRCLQGGMPWWKFIGNVVLTGWQNLCIGAKLTDPHSGLRVYSRRYLEQVPFEQYNDGFLFDAQIILDGVARGLRIHEIPIPTRYFAEASQMGWHTGLRYAAGIMTLSSRQLIRRIDACQPIRVAEGA